MLLALALLSIGSSLSRAPVFGLLSNLTPANEQGGTIGVAQSAGALARIVGPMFAASLYVHDCRSCRISFAAALPSWPVCSPCAAAGEIIFRTPVFNLQLSTGYKKRAAD